MGAIRRKKRSKYVVSASPQAVDSSQMPPSPENQDISVKVNTLQALARKFWRVAKPYWYSEDKVQARLQLAAVFALTLGTTGISVGFNFLGRDFYNALANKDQEQFTKQLLYYLGAFAGGIPFFVLRDYAKETLALRWRAWMTSYYMDRYLKKQSYYLIQSQSLIDNPDQRIVDDLSSFTGTTLSFALTLFNAVVDLISFSNILLGIYPPLFIVLLVYSLGGTSISLFLGKGLVTLNFLQEKKEADFRYGLVRIRENAESIAFYGGEKNEMQLLLQRFRSAFENLTQLLIASRNLEFFTSGYRYLIQILPAAVVAPMYFSGRIEFGVINQSVSAFNHILGDFSLIVYQIQALSAFSAVIDRLGEFDDALETRGLEDRYDPLESIQLKYSGEQITVPVKPDGPVPLKKSHKLLGIDHLTLQTPMGGGILIRDLCFEIKESDHLLITGPSGSGKTSLLRASAGLWNYGRGQITFYNIDDRDPQLPISPNGTSVNEAGEFSERWGKRISRKVFFLPQKPYMVLGTLRQQLLYPTWAEGSMSESQSAASPGSMPSVALSPSSADMNTWPQKPTTDDLVQVLKDVRLGHLLERFNSLDSIYDWANALSLGEQQRLAFARLLLSRPSLALLDEATSALDEKNEDHLYRKIEEAGVTYISIGHRRTLYKYHTRVLHISTLDPTSNARNWYIEPVNRDILYDLARQ